MSYYFILFFCADNLFIPWIFWFSFTQYRADDMHLKKGGTDSLEKFLPPWLGDEENFEIYKI